MELVTSMWSEMALTVANTVAKDSFLFLCGLFASSLEFGSFDDVGEFGYERNYN